MKRRDFFKFLPGAALSIPTSVLSGRSVSDGKIPIYLPPNPKPGDLMTAASIKGETVMVDMNVSLDKQFSGEYLQRVQDALKFR